MSDTPEALARDVAAVGRLSAVPSLLRVVCQTTGMGFAAVARVTDHTWTACAVQDDIGFGLRPGGQLDLRSTLCYEVRSERKAVVIDHASIDPVYCNHHTPRQYQIESYISVPIVMPNGDYFGNLCAIDPRPAQVANDRVLTMFTLFAELIALQLDGEARHEADRSALSSERATAELREQFIAVLGHDLRNPLAAVSATAGVLSRRTTHPDIAAMGQRLRSATRRMSRLIDDVLDFARGRLGDGLDVDFAPIGDLGQALHDVVAEVREANPARSIVGTFDIGREVVGDRARLQQLLSNLLGNAVTYGDPAEPVHVSVTAGDEGLSMRVTNRGTPIPPAHLGRVFEPYWRPLPPEGRTGGLGLGLYICAQIVKAHGGSLGVSSSAETGTCFEVRLPLRASSVK